jgi:hypothetical protein
MQLLQASPNLANLGINGPRLSILEGVSWLHLQSFVASLVSPKDLFLLLANCPAIDSYDVTVVITDPDLYTPNAPTVHPCLRSLFLKSLNEHNSIMIVTWITFPGFKTLLLAGLGFNVEKDWFVWPNATFITFLSRSEFTLKCLVFSDLPTLKDRVLSYLRHPSIHTLEEFELHQ